MSAGRHVAAVGIVVMLAGCAIGKPLPSVTTYLIEPPVKELHARRWPDALRIGRVRVASAFSGKALAYRYNDVQYVSDPYHQLIAEPGAMLGSQIATWLDHLQLFETVSQPESTRPARYVLDATVIELYGDFREGHRPAAMMKVQFVLLDQSGPRPAVVHEETIASHTELAQASAEELVRGYGTALADILSQWVTELDRVRTSSLQ